MVKKVIAAGHVCVDITPAFQNEKITSIDEILKPGKLVSVGGADVHTGGSVANTGLAMKFLGADVKLMGKIGNDAFGRMILQIMAQHGTDKDMIVTDEDSTSYSIVLAVPGIDRIFLHNAGANDTFCSDDVPEEDLEEAALLHFGYPPVMKAMYDHDGEELVRLMQRARKAGAATSLDLAAVDANSDAGKQNWRKILERTLPWVDIFVPSIEELCFMLDRDRFDSWQKRAEGADVTSVLDPEKDVRPLAEECLEMGAKIVLLKCGAPGMYLRTADKETLEKMPARIGLDAASWAGLDQFERSYVPDRILSGTGAGDTSIAAFLTAILKEYSPQECLHLAAAEGASCVTAYDALSGLLSLDDLERKIKAGWKKTER